MLTPANEKEVSELVAGLQAPVRVQGGGTRPVGVSAAPEQLSVAALKGVELYEPGALTLVVQAGTPVAQIEALLAAENQRLAFEPMDHRGLLGTSGEPTIGGVVAANVSGPRRIQAGACRDFLLGVRYVDGLGRVIRNGGRVMKNVTGYDLARLLAGSRGTLGVLTEVAFKVLPGVELEATLAFDGLSAVDAVALMSATLGSPYDVTGVACLNGRALIRVEGFAPSVRERLTKLQARLATFGEAEEISGDASAALWREVRDVAPFHAAEGEVWRLSVKPSDAPGVLAALPGTEALLDWGGGLIWLLVPPGAGLGAAQIRAALPAGHATRIRGAHGPDSFMPQPAAVAALEAGLRQRFDPKGLFMPGLMGA